MIANILGTLAILAPFLVGAVAGGLTLRNGWGAEDAAVTAVLAFGATLVAMIVVGFAGMLIWEVWS